MKKLLFLLVVLLTACGSNPKPALVNPPSLTVKSTHHKHHKKSKHPDPSPGNVLTTSNGTWNGTPTSYTYQWSDCSAGTCVPISGATSSSYTVQSSDVGDTIVVSVTAHNANGASAPATSAATTTVTNGAVTTFVAQTAVGSGDASSCANAEAVSTLNANTHLEWAADKVIGLCGTITSTITAAGSGTTGHPITVLWTTGAKLSQPFCPGDNTSSGCFNTNGQTNLTLDGGTNGIIESSANGSLLANHIAVVAGIRAMACNGCTIKNLTIQNMYVHLTNNSTNDPISHIQNNAIRFSGSNFTIQNNTIHDAGWALNQVLAIGVNDANVTITGNNIYNSDHTWALQGPNANGGNFGPFVFANNHAHDWGNWDNANNDYHHDGLHCFSQNGTGATPHYNGVYIYNNRWDGTNGDLHMTSDIFLEGGSGATTTPCSDNTSVFYIYNNVFIGSDAIGNGLVGPENNSMDVREYNNTLIGGTTTGGICQYDPGSVMTFKNNVMTTCNTLIQKQAASSFVAGSPDFDVYANSSSNEFVCNGTFTSSFATWKTCSGGDAGGQAVSSAGLNADGSPAVGSATLNGGTNLTSLCAGSLTALCTTYSGPPSGGGAGSTTTGSARPTGATAWNAGAY